MKLLSCYIEGFGTFVKKSFTFDDALTSYLEKNGFGKTTLATFISVMFYGMETTAANSKNFTVREHYYPFESCAYYGGTLTLEWNGKEYRIEKSFDVKSETKDTCTVYCNGVKDDGFTDKAKLGDKFFGINKEAFAKTIFVDYTCVETSTNASINAMLGDANGTFDENHLTLVDGAIKTLTTARDKFKTPSGRGVSEIKQCTDTIKALQDGVNQKESIVATLPKKREELSQALENLKVVNAELKKANKFGEMKAHWDHYNGIKAEAEQHNATLEKLKQKYPNGTPTRQEILNSQERLEEMKKAHNVINSTNVSEEQNAELAKLKNIFSTGVPTSEELVNIANVSKRALGTKLEIVRLSGEQGQSVLEERLPNKAEVDKLQCDLERYKDMQKRLDPSYPESVPKTLAGAQAKSNPLIPTLLALFTLALVGGGICFIFSVIAGAILTGVGAIGTAIFAVQIVKNKPNTAQTDNPAWVQLNADKNAVYNSICETLSYYSCQEDSVEVGVYKLVKKYNDNVAINEKRAQASENIKNLENVLRQDCLYLDSLFNKYELYDGDYDEKLTALHVKIKRYESLCESKANEDKNKTQAQKLRDDNKQAITTFANKYGLILPFDLRSIHTLLQEVASDVEDVERTEQAYKNKLKQAEEFKAKHNLAPIPENAVDNDKVHELEGKKNTLEECIISLRNDVERAEIATEDLAKLKADLDEQNEILKDLTARHSALQKTIDMLKLADENLKEKVIKPTNDAFKKYAVLIKNKLGVDVVIGKNFSVVFEKNGIQKSENYLSSGQRAIVSLCYRLALIENMYKTNLPFIILDDPFVNLDEENLAIVKNFLKDVSKSFQTIYLSCHESRTI